MVNFAVPNEESLFSFFGLHKIIYHYMLMLTPAIVLGTGYFKLRFKDIYGTMIIFVSFGVPVYIFNAIFKQDYMFTYNGSWLPMDVSFIPSKILYTLLVLVVYVCVALLFIAINIVLSKLCKKKS